MKMRSIHASTTLQAPSAPGATSLVAFNVGPAGELYFVSALRDLDYQKEIKGFATIGKVIPDSPQQYRIQSLENGQASLDVLVTDEEFNIHDIQPVGDELLLVCARSRWRSANEFDRNGRVYGQDGIFRREILLGDGIQTIQCTRTGQIWTSYFDEGVFGNYGWRNPVGASGLVAWNARGEKLLVFEAPEECGFVADCYAMNVAADEDVWCCYYSDFPLVRVQHRRITSHWSSPVRGSPAFAVGDGYVLFAGSYDESDVLHLVRLGSDRDAELVGKFQMVASDETPVSFERVVGRGKKLYALAGDKLHVADVDDVVAQR